LIAIDLQIGCLAARLTPGSGDSLLPARTTRWWLAQRLAISEGVGAAGAAVLAASQSTRRRRSSPSCFVHVLLICWLSLPVKAQCHFDVACRLEDGVVLVLEPVT
jgi:hypothetical protein